MLYKGFYVGGVLDALCVLYVRAKLDVLFAAVGVQKSETRPADGLQPIFESADRDAANPCAASPVGGLEERIELVLGRLGLDLPGLD
jgi:hypothetical protein